MGHRTVQRLPRFVHTYEHAKMIHDNSKPIRGRVPEVRPLGERRDCDTYHVRMNGEVVEFVLYKTPVISYHPDNTIEIKTGGWDTVSTRQMFSHVLNIGANGQRSKTIISIGDQRYVMGDESMKLKKAEGKHGLEVLSYADTYGYQLNRKKMNEVRKSYSEFIRYIKTFVSLREQTTTSRRFGFELETTHIDWTVGEAAECIGARWAVPNGQVSMADLYLCNDEWFLFDKLPNEGHTYMRFKAAGGSYEDASSKFFALCTNAQDDNTKHTNFHKAMMVMLTAGQGLIRASADDLTEVRTTRNMNVLKYFELAMKKFHRKEILERVHMAGGKIPNPVYELWMKEVK